MSLALNYQEPLEEEIGRLLNSQWMEGGGCQQKDEGKAALESAYNNQVNVKSCQWRRALVLVRVPSSENKNYICNGE